MAKHKKQFPYRKGRTDKTLEPIEIKPTFPLDANEVHVLRETLIGQTPKYLVWQALAQLGSRVSFLSRFTETWSQTEAEISKAVVEHVVKQSNEHQNRSIRLLIQGFEQRWRKDHAELLTKFLWVKQIIETAFKTNQRLSAQRADVEMLVDSILQKVCNELVQLTELQVELNSCLTDSRHDLAEKLKEQIGESQERIARAYDTLKETEKQTTTYQQPTCASESNASESMVLDKLIDSLREENEVAKTINERVRTELSV